MIVLLILCVAVMGWMWYSGSKVCERTEKLLDAVEYYLFRVLGFIALASIVGLVVEYGNL